MFLDRFDVLTLKIKKKYYFNLFQTKKYFKKQLISYF